MADQDNRHGGGGEYQPFLEALERHWPPEEALARREEFGYDRETCLLFGEWMLRSVTEVYGERQRITRDIVEVASKNGYGPSEEPLKRNFGGALWRFNEELGSLYGRSIGRFDEWAEDDFITYGHQAILRHGADKPDKAIFDKEFENGRGPSLVLIADRFGERGAYFERLGYVSPKRWSRGDYVNWAADVAASGIGLELTAATIKHIAKFRRGPSDKAIYRNFGGLIELQSAAQTRSSGYTDDQVEAASRRFGVFSFDIADHAEGDSTHHALSTSLRLIATEGRISATLSPSAVILLDLLLRHVDAPVYRDDFYEQYLRGDGRSKADATAFEELQSISFLSPHLVSLQVGSERVYGLSSMSDDISLLVQRSETAASYMSGRKLESEPKEPAQESEHHHLRTVTLSALGLVAAGASILLVRHSRRSN